MCIMAQLPNYEVDDEAVPGNDLVHDGEDMEDPEEEGERYLGVLRRGRLAREQVVQFLENQGGIA